MQRGIDSFFKRLPSNNKKSDEDASPAPKKRKARVISSDEDEIAESPQVNKTGKDHKKLRRALDDTPSPNKAPTKKPSLSKLKNAVPTKRALQKVDPSALFGGETKRIEAQKPPRPKDKSIIELEDEEIDQSLMEVDLDESVKAAESHQQPPAIEISKSLSPPPPIKRAKRATPSPEPPKAKAAGRTPKSEKPKTPKARARASNGHADLDTSVLSDEERHERKRMTAVLYQKYKNRASCLNPGCKEIPKGTPDCLKGYTFLVTGILESMERGEAESVIKEYGGRVMTVVGKKLNYLVVGEEAGPKKLAQADEFNVTVLSEDGLFDLIRERSGLTNGSKNGEKSIKKEKEESSNKLKVKQEKSESMKSPRDKKDKQKEHSPPKAELKVKKEKRDSSKSPRVPDIKEKHSDTHISPKKELKVEPKKDPQRLPSNNATNAQTTADKLAATAWVDKYKPASTKEIVGQAGAASNVNKLLNWLTKWYVNHDGKKKLQRPNPWAKNDDGSFYKAALLSGPPGIGKTTTATLVCKELGFDTVEFNASDTRSKKLLKEEVSSLLSNKSLYGFVNGRSQAVSKKHVLLMDEVDGMAGNEDRGGMQELIALIKDSSVPIICMCNDRNHPKIRSLVNYCYDLRFQRPRLEQIKGRIMMICCREQVKMSPAKVEEIIAATNNDIRQSINHIALLSAGEKLDLMSKSQPTDDKIAQKDIKLGPWDVVRKVFSAEDHKHMSLYDKCDLFFHDYSMAPLFVQQNYLQVTPQGPRKDILSKVAATAEALSLGDLVDRCIRGSSAWSLLPTQAVFSSLLPGEYMCGHFTGQINFPGWLGKNSRSNKRSRLAQELHDHTRIRTSGSRQSMRLDYAPYLLSNIVRPMATYGQEGVAAALDVMKDYHLLREDLDSLIELTTWPGKKSPMDAVDGRVKAALTRSYNKEVLAYSYSVQTNIKKKRAEAVADEEGMLDMEGVDEDGGTVGAVDSDDEDNDDLELDGLIKAKKKPPASTSKASTSKASTSKKPSAAASKPKAKAKK
ncbi:replication factor C subunit 1 [Scaptodrosophila lebanonensis]|uniref:Replication factor C subunit 1 n=1 Tax=Drosophila lebanonensis TaxID=7225 RepID=A0A6J2THF0_DROLE|nr:replication factor C subunit 1 [Scaptodrosophila lebanonensis]